MASHQAVSSNIIRFGGEFDLDLGAYELRRSGRRLRLARIPMELLLLLLEQPGQLVTREQIAERVWGKDVFLDIDNGINAVVRRIRNVLGDDPEEPRFIQTVVGRGYRFIATVQGATASPFLPAPEAQPPESFLESGETTQSRGRIPSRSRQMLVVSTVALVFVIGALIARGWLHHQSPPQPFEVIPLTALPGQEISPSFSPDGSQVAFGWDGETNGAGFDLYVKVIGTDTPLRLTNHPAPWLGIAWSPDGRYIAVHRLATENGGIFLVPALGGFERKLASTNNFVPQPHVAAISWSPDGKELAFADHFPLVGVSTQLFSLSLDTLERKQIDTGCDYVFEPGFSPRRDSLAYTCIQDDGHFSLNLRDLRAGKNTRLLDGPQRIHGTAWTHDGARIVFSYDSSSFTPLVGGDLWQITPHHTESEKMPFGHDAAYPIVSSFSNRLAYVQTELNANIWRVDPDGAKAHAHMVVTSTREQYAPSISPDGRRVVFESNRSGSEEIWVCDSDGGNAQQLTSLGGGTTGTPRWSPDGRQIVFDSRLGGEANVYVIEANGGVPRKLETGTRMNSLPSWSHDGKWIYFASGLTHSNLTVWRVAATGGRAIQLTKTTSSMPIESPDGQHVYFVRFTQGKFRLWRVRPDGSGESMVDAMPPLRTHGYEWWPFGSGIYFYSYAGSKPEIDFLDLGTSRIRRICTLDKPPAPWLGGLSASPDAKWFLYSRIDETASDLMLVENFH